MTILSRRVWLPALVILAMTALTGCNLPLAQPTGDFFATAAARTVEFQLTALIVGPGGTTPIPPSATIALPPTNTPPIPTVPPTATYTPSVTPLPCDRAEYVTDVNYPDGTDVAPGAAFTKTWRLRNIGTCTWTSGYALVFDHGDSMGGSAATTLTSGTVAPGQTVDVSVNLTAPAAAGTYRGYWRLRNPSGVIFGTGASATGSLWVEIDVVPATTTVTLTATGESGTVMSDGWIGVTTPRNAGDTGSNATSEAFFSFDITGIPAGSTITAVTFNLGGFDTLGNPFADLGCVYMYQQDYGSLDVGDFVAGSPSGGLTRICNAAGLGTAVADNDFITALQSKVGSSRFQVRMQFADTAVSADGQADIVRFPLISMTLSYYH